MYFLIRLHIHVFGLTPSIIRFTVLRSRMLNKVCVDGEQNVLLQTLECGYLSETHFLIRLRRRFSVSRFTMLQYNHVVIKQATCACRKLLFVYTNFPLTICTCPVQTAQTLVCPTLFVYTGIYVRAPIRLRRGIAAHMCTWPLIIML